MQQLTINKNKSIFHKDSGATLFSLHDAGDNNKFLGWCDRATWKRFNNRRIFTPLIKGGVILVNSSFTSTGPIENAYVLNSELTCSKVIGISSKPSQRVVIKNSKLSNSSINDCHGPSEVVTKRHAPTVIVDSAVESMNESGFLAIQRCKLIGATVVYANMPSEADEDELVTVRDSFIKNANMHVENYMHISKAAIVNSFVNSGRLTSTERFEVINMHLATQDVVMDKAVVKKTHHFFKHTFADGNNLYLVNRRGVSNQQQARYSVDARIASEPISYGYSELIEQNFCTAEMTIVAANMINILVQMRSRK